ncbi:hypothetical protein CTAYLR_010752 [Chrysophaeum taylorii]|uniref:Uncharacterized protein n=1 Tax=Chrysophaeum taylorii TaxID=2483200 RepID=A0AAD7XNH2_9STRA|nr:hypothetical protein CTAYLR_010752 [Chrysophaeum taylorii]
MSAPRADLERSDTRWILSTEELANSPSRRDGIKAEDEKKKRRQTVSFIEECGKKLKLPKLPVVVAETYLNRFSTG